MDDLENELNRLFRDERLDMLAAPDAENAVVAGAKRVRRRRVVLMSAAGVLSAVVLAGGALVLARPSPQSSEMAHQPSDLPVYNTTSSSTSATVPPPTAMPDTSSIIESSAPMGSSEARPTGTRQPGNGTSSLIPAPPAGTAILGPTGFGKMRLGMTESELFATGQVRGSAEPNPGCVSYQTKSAGGTVVLSATHGVVSFTFTTGVATPERIGIGSTQEAAKVAYPSLSGNSVAAPGNANATYQFTFSSGKITRLTLAANQQDCTS